MIVGVGVDAVEIARIRTAVTRTPTLLDRLYTPTERLACTHPDGRLRHGGLAARFAAKEAVAKALGTGIRGFAWTDVEIYSDALGKPAVRLRAGARTRASDVGADRFHVSLATAREIALAYVVAEGGTPA